MVFFQHSFINSCPMTQLITLFIPLSAFFIAHLLISGVVSTIFRITNKCDYTIWPATYSSNADSPLSTTGFSLEKNESKRIIVPDTWAGHLWGRIYCSTQDDRGKFSCRTGDCGSGKLECSGHIHAPPVTLAKFSLLDSDGIFDSFYVSFADGYNLPVLVMTVDPFDPIWKAAGCSVDLNSKCPSKIKVTSSDGTIVGCNSACSAFGLSQYCCNGTYNKAESCKPSSYSQFFEKSCPLTQSYAGDLKEAVIYCKPTNYDITFCPGDKTPSPLPAGKTPSPSPEIFGPKTSRRRHLAPMVTGFTGGGLLITYVVIIIIRRVRCWGGKYKNAEEDVEDNHIKQVPGVPVRFSYEDLRVATDDFKEELGRGGFGSVFKGKLADGTHIAVNRLERLGQGMSAFLAEAEAIGSLHPFNLVRLIGLCAEKSSKLLAFDYMSNRSLDTWIFKKDQRSCLDWETRKKIIVDIAKGLAYLHEECRQKIIHFDIKPQNILLDENFNAKISDFGLSKLIDRDISQAQISMRGTPGYMAPEWCTTSGRITAKVDTYSFGMVLLEVVCARRNVDRSQPESAFHLLTMLQKKGEQDRLIEIVETLDDHENMQSDIEEIIRMIKIAAWCLQDDPERRPAMSTVVKVLEGVMEVDSNLVYKFSHALTSSPVVNQHISSKPMSAFVLSNPR